MYIKKKLEILRFQSLGAKIIEVKNRWIDKYENHYGLT